MSVPIIVHAWAGQQLTKSSSLSDVPALLSSGATVWIDAEGKDDGLSTLLTETLKLHPLAVEDILESQSTPKVEDYGEYLYLVAHHLQSGQDAAGCRRRTLTSSSRGSGSSRITASLSPASARCRRP